MMVTILTSDILRRVKKQILIYYLSIEKERYDPSLKLAFKMARFFEVKIEVLFEDEEPSISGDQ